MDLSRLSTATKVITGAAILLLIDTFLDWQQVCFASVCGGQSAWHGITGWLLGLLVVALIAWQIVKILEVDLPDLPVEDRQIEMGVVGGIVIFAILKFITAGDFRHWWVQIVGLILVAVIAWFEWQKLQGRDAAPAGAASESSAPAAAAPASTPAPAAAPAPVAPVGGAPMTAPPEATTPDTPDQPGAPEDPATGGPTSY
jgi:hypothetical protein